MGIVIGIVGSFVLAAMVAILWVNCINDMKENHPDYKGEDLFNDDLDQ